MSKHAPGQARAAIVTGPRQLEIREFPLPELGEEDGLLEVEVNGICGSDAEFYAGTLDGYPLPMTLGHEPVGRIVALGEVARARWGVNVGDRVVVNSALRCGHCGECAAGRDCRSASYGTLSPDQAPGLWGGLATHLYLDPRATLIPISPQVSTAAVAFHNPLANGFEWTGEAGQADERSRVAVLGAGPRGFACALVAVFLGGEHVTMVGLQQDRGRLELAERMGVHTSLVVQTQDETELRDRLGYRPNVVIDTTPHSTSAVEQALCALESGGRLVLAGIKGRGRSIDLEIDTLVSRRLTVTGPWSKTEKSLRRAVSALESGELDLSLIPSKAYPLEETAVAVESLSLPDADKPLHVRVEPGEMSQ
ncbi:zinc-dependent alcohol dehydrogenase [Streptomyces odonnellii]|uniref:zinc-dependent alcohol dehydrogenase n=1 Tax=Streptomyces odonnellii TaxID=1417980 RepID=UPI00062536AC|nr:alcohol dehydrogenase catalytic domain-containing protein [Streptomyces odonnellii]